jgi:hypothetical protein
LTALLAVSYASLLDRLSWFVNTKESTRIGQDLAFRRQEDSQRLEFIHKMAGNFLVSGIHDGVQLEFAMGQYKKIHLASFSKHFPMYFRELPP